MHVTNSNPATGAAPREGQAAQTVSKAAAWKLVPVLCAAAVVGSIYVRHRREPEHLLEYNVFGHVVNERLFQTTQPGGTQSMTIVWPPQPSLAANNATNTGAQIVSNSVHNKDWRTHVDEGQSSIYLINDYSVAESERLLYIKSPLVRAMAGIVGGVATGRRSPTTYLGEFMRAPNWSSTIATPGLKRTPGRALVLQSTPTNPVRSLDLRTGALDTIGAIDSTSAVVSGSTIYWMRVHPDDGDSVQLEGSSWREIQGHSELCSLSISDKSTHVLRSDLPSSTRLTVGSAGIIWTQPRQYPDTRRDLFYWRNSEATPHVIAPWTGNREYSPPTEYHGQLYWFACDKPDAGSGQGVFTADHLMTADMDGKNPRVLMDFNSGAAGSNTWANALAWSGGQSIGPVVVRDALYCILEHDAPGSKSESGPWLCRIQPDSRNPIESLVQLPKNSAQFQIDGNYLYFIHNEIKRTPLARLTNDEAGQQYVPTLCRIKFTE